MNKITTTINTYYRYKWAKDSMNRTERQGLLSDYITLHTSERIELRL